jgi:Flp pilus assembly protein TadG
VGTRNPSEAGLRSHAERGTTSVQMLVLLVPVIFALMGFAVDLGRLYLIRGELKTAANAMALAAAQQLIGTEAALENATAMALLTLDQGSGIGNRYNFGMLRLGETTGLLASEMPQLAYFATLDAALAGDETASQASGTEARYVRVTVSAEAPLTFWGLLSLGAERKTLVRAQAVAGISAPLCTACGIEPIAIPAPNPQDSVHFDLQPGTRYTFAHWCQSGRPPQALRDDARDILYYVLLNPYDEAGTPADEQTQLYRFGAQGLRRSNGPAVPCVSIGSPKETWPGTGRTSCDQSVPSGVTSFLCGLATRLLDAPPQGCEGFSELESPTDRDLEDRLDYASYQGNARRVITVAVVDQIQDPTSMTVLGFRQFLLEPDPRINPSDQHGRFAALYIGYPVPLRQGRFDGCGVAAGPGKVVLHQ